MIIRLFKRALRVCAVLLIGGFIALFALTCVFRLQPRRMYENLQSSIYTFHADGQYPSIIRHHESTMLDNFTDALMINQAIFSHPDIDPFQRAIHIYQWILPGQSAQKTANLAYLLENEPQGMNLTEYGRYWHGYIVLLRPLLLLFDYEELRMLIVMIQILLMSVVIALLCCRGKIGLFIAFIGYILVISPTGTVLSLQYFHVHCITLCALITILLFEKRMGNAAYEWLFLAVGMMTSFFDLLTFPIVSFGIPACLMLCLCGERNMKSTLLALVHCGVMWCVGYLGFWMVKWSLATIFGGINMFAEAFRAVQIRTSDEVISSAVDILKTRGEAIVKNLAPISSRPFLAAGIAISCGGGILCFLHCGKTQRRSPALCTALLLIAATPFAWWWVTANHAYIHYWFTYRCISVTVFAVLACLFGGCDTTREAADLPERKMQVDKG